MLGSCTGNAVANAYELLVLKTMPNKFVELSRLFVYYNSRLVEGNVSVDDGAYMKSSIRALYKYGICSESIWPYDISKFAVKPSTEAYTDATYRLIQNYRRVASIDNVIDALNSDYPVVFGMDVYKDFESVYDVVPIPDKNAEPTGAHAMCLVGYDMDKKYLLAKNSFGTDWGMQGYCWIPFGYAQDHMFDMWVFDLLTK